MNDRRGRTMSRDELKDLIYDCVDAKLVDIGINPQEPLVWQRKFQYLSSLEVSANTIKRSSLLAIIGALFTASLGALWVGIKAALTGGG